MSLEPQLGTKATVIANANWGEAATLFQRCLI
jgi:hypothetical protein